MIVNNAIEFQQLVLKCGLREGAEGELREILDCVQFYSTMCGCQAEAKQAKYVECDLRYRNFINNNLSSVKDRILAYEQEVTFNYQEGFIAFISRQ